MPPKKAKINLENVTITVSQVNWLIGIMITIGSAILTGVLAYTKVQYDQREELRGLRRDLDTIVRDSWTLAEQREYAHQTRNLNVHIVSPNVDSIRHEIRKTDK